MSYDFNIFLATKRDHGKLDETGYAVPDVRPKTEGRIASGEIDFKSPKKPSEGSAVFNASCGLRTSASIREEQTAIRVDKWTSRLEFTKTIPSLALLDEITCMSVSNLAELEHKYGHASNLVSSMAMIAFRGDRADNEELAYEKLRSFGTADHLRNVRHIDPDTRTIVYELDTDGIWLWWDIKHTSEACAINPLEATQEPNFERIHKLEAQ